jgi:hypothetical protein
MTEWVLECVLYLLREIAPHFFHAPQTPLLLSSMLNDGAFYAITFRDLWLRVFSVYNVLWFLLSPPRDVAFSECSFHASANVRHAI